MSHKWFSVSHEISFIKILQPFNIIEHRVIYALAAYKICLQKFSRLGIAATRFRYSEK